MLYIVWFLFMVHYIIINYYLLFLTINLIYNVFFNVCKLRDILLWARAFFYLAIRFFFFVIFIILFHSAIIASFKIICFIFL
jgi:hypothetical protein